MLRQGTRTFRNPCRTTGVAYTAEIVRKEPHPKALVQYIRAAQAAVRDGGDLSPGVDIIASGLIRLADRVGDVGQLRRKPRTHRAIVRCTGG